MDEGIPDLANQVAGIIKNLLAPDGEWEKRYAALQSLEALCKKGAAFGNFAERMEKYQDEFAKALQPQVTDLRSEIVRQTMATLEAMSTVLGNLYVRCFNKLAVCLVDLTGARNNIIRGYGQQMLVTVLRYAHSPRLLNVVIDTLVGTKDKMIQEACGDALKCILTYWPVRDKYAKHSDSFDAAIKFGLACPTPKARETFADVFWLFVIVYPERQMELLVELEPRTRKNVEKVRPPNVKVEEAPVLTKSASSETVRGAAAPPPATGAKSGRRNTTEAAVGGGGELKVSPGAPEVALLDDGGADDAKDKENSASENKRRVTTAVTGARTTAKGAASARPASATVSAPKKKWTPPEEKVVSRKDLMQELRVPGRKSSLKTVPKAKQKNRGALMTELRETASKIRGSKKGPTEERKGGPVTYDPKTGRPISAGAAGAANSGTNSLNSTLRSALKPATARAPATASTKADKDKQLEKKPSTSKKAKVDGNTSAQDVSSPPPPPPLPANVTPPPPPPLPSSVAAGKAAGGGGLVMERLKGNLVGPDRVAW